MSADGFEFRVLSGVHEGAVAFLPRHDAQAHWRVAPDDEADLMLSDLPLPQATLSLLDDGWHWEDALGSLHLAWGQAMRLGGLCLQAALASDPVPTAEQCQALPDRLAQAVPGPEADAEASAEAPVDRVDAPDRAAAGALSAEAGGPVADPRHKASLPTARPRRRWHRALPLAGLLALALGLLGGAQLWLQQAGVHEAQRPDGIEDSPLDPVQALQAVQRQLGQAGLGAAVRATAVAGGRIRLLGVVGSDDAMDTLLARLAPWLSLLKVDLLTQAEFARNVAALAPRWPALRLTAEPGGRVRVSGPVGPDLDRAVLGELIAQALPEASAVSLDDLAMAQGPGAGASPRGVARSATERLPQVAAVVSGERAYVLLADGRRLLPGGLVRQGLVLARIDDNAVIFQTSAGQTLTLPRGAP